MEVLRIVLLVFFVINALLLILLVLIQNDEGGGLGGMFAGGANTAFGSRSGNVLTRATTVLGSLFLIISLSLAFISRTPAGTGVEEEARRITADESGYNWLEEELNPSPPSVNDFIFDFDEIESDFSGDLVSNDNEDDQTQ